MDLDGSIERAGNWLAESGIQRPVGAHRGAAAAWFDADAGQYSFLYSEIAGYTLTCFCYLHGLTGRKEYLEGARLAAEWLEGEALSGGAYRCRLNPGEDDFVNWQCSFDNAMILNGLANLHRATGDGKYLAMAERGASWLVGKMQNPDGSFHAKMEPSTGKHLDWEERWSTQPAALHLKHAMGLANLADITGNAAYSVSAARVCDWGLRFQGPDGRFVTNPALGDTYTHPHCYAMEGLATAGFKMDGRYLAHAARAAAWLPKALTAGGGISQHFDGVRFSGDEHVDSMAQTARLWMALDGCEGLAIGRETLDRLVGRILEFQCGSADMRIDGGFLYGTVDGRLRNHVSNHGTMFALQALLMYRDFVEGKRGLDMFLYI